MSVSIYIQILFTWRVTLFDGEPREENRQRMWDTLQSWKARVQSHAGLLLGILMRLFGNFSIFQPLEEGRNK